MLFSVYVKLYNNNFFVEIVMYYGVGIWGIKICRKIEFV